MPPPSAGILLFRQTSSQSAGALEVLLAHPGGPFWAKKDDGAWSIPKGEIEDGEAPLDAALREFREETGFSLTEADAARATPLSPVKMKSGKLVHAWAVERDLDPAGFTSITFSVEWPPKSGKHKEFPEVDRLEWFTLEAARRKILPGQAPLLDQLEASVPPR